MELRQLSMLIAVSEHRSFTGAARALHTVQSNVSTHIRRLETELGVTLFERPSARLTPEGEVVLERARRVQIELDAIANDVASLAREISGRVRIGMIGTTGRFTAPALIDKMRHQHPAVQTVIVESTTSGLLAELSNGTIDLAVVNLPLDDPDLQTEPLFAEELVLVTPPQHPLAGRSHALFSELADHELLLGPQGSAIRDDLDALAAELGLKLKVTAEIDGVRLLASLAFQGHGAAVIPASAIPTWVTGDWSVVEIAERPKRLVGLTRRKRSQPSAPAEALHDVLLEVLADEIDERPGLEWVHPSRSGRSSDHR